MRPRNRRLAVVAALAPAVVAAAATGVQMTRERTALSTLETIDEVETYLITPPAGARVRAIARARSKSLRVGVAIADDRVEPTVQRRVATASLVTDGPTRTLVVSVSSGGTGTGEYSLFVDWTVPSGKPVRHNGRGLPDPVPFSGEVGTSIKVRSSGRDADGRTVPVIVSLTDADGDHLDDSEQDGLLEVPYTGDFRLVAVAPGGPVERSVVTARVRPPALPRSRIDLTDARFGKRRSVEGVIGAFGGSLIMPPPPQESDFDRDVTGSAAVVPSGALFEDTLFVIRTGFGIDVSLPALYPVGPAVEYDAESRPFMRDVVTTIPFDAAAFGGDPSKVRVFTRLDDGQIVEVQGVTVDLAAGTISFPASHFSSFQVFGASPVIETVTLGVESNELVAGLRTVDADRVVFVTAGSASGAGSAYLVNVVTGAATQLLVPQSIAVAPDGSDGYFFATTTRRIGRLAADGGVTIVAGSGAATSSGDGGPPLQAGMSPRDILRDGQGRLLVVDPAAPALRRIDFAANEIRTLAQLPSILSVASASDGSVFAVTPDVVWRLDEPASTFTLVAGVLGSSGSRAGDGGPLDSIRFGRCLQVCASDGADGIVLHVADAGRHCIWRLDLVRSRGHIVAGADGTAGFDGDAPGGAAPGLFNTPSGIASIGLPGDVAILDGGNRRLRTIRLQR